ncbi:unnamed protein product [Gadus morhua 'NCC']
MALLGLESLLMAGRSDMKKISSSEGGCGCRQWLHERQHALLKRGHLSPTTLPTPALFWGLHSPLAPTHRSTVRGWGRGRGRVAGAVAGWPGPGPGLGLLHPLLVLGVTAHLPLHETHVYAPLPPPSPTPGMGYDAGGWSLFGVPGNCAACSKLIPAFEMVMRARDNVYHLDRQRLCVGDTFFLKNNMILCQVDYDGGRLNGSTDRQSQ